MIAEDDVVAIARVNRVRGSSGKNDIMTITGMNAVCAAMSRSGCFVASLCRQ